MRSAASAFRRAHVRRAAIALAWRPEWPIAAIVGMAWATLAALQLSPESHAGHDLSSSAPATTLAASVGRWGLMALLMMVPVTMPAIRHVGLNTIKRRRLWAMAVYVVSYLTVWVTFGALALLLVRFGRGIGAGERQLIVLTLSLAAAWQLTPSKRRAIVACRRTVPLPPSGWRADLACARFGVYQAWRCVVACWPLMLLMAVIGHELVLMMALTIVVVAEDRAPMRDRLLLPSAVALGAMTVFAALRQ